MHRLIALVPLAIHLSAQSPQVIRAVPTDYPKLARIAQLAGVVDVDVSLNQDGSVADVLEIPDTVKWKQLFPSAARAAKQWIFSPGTKSPVRITYVFHLYPKDTPASRLQPELLSPTMMAIKATVLFVDKTPLIEPKNQIK